MLLCSPGGIGFYGTAADVEGIPLLMLPLQPGAPTKEWPHILQDPDVRKHAGTHVVAL